MLCLKAKAGIQFFIQLHELYLKFKKWFDHNVLIINVDKTKYMPMSLRTQGDTLNNVLTIIHCCGTTNAGDACDFHTIERVYKYKYLGVIIDSRKFLWAVHLLGN